jgi:hypothetical protein
MNKEKGGRSMRELSVLQFVQTDGGNTKHLRRDVRYPSQDSNWVRDYQHIQ